MYLCMHVGRYIFVVNIECRQFVAEKSPARLERKKKKERSKEKK